MSDHLETLITKEAAIRGLRFVNLFEMADGRWRCNVHYRATGQPAGLGFYTGATPTEAVEKVLRDVEPPAAPTPPSDPGSLFE